MSKLNLHHIKNQLDEMMVHLLELRNKVSIMEDKIEDISVNVEKDDVQCLAKDWDAIRDIMRGESQRQIYTKRK